MGTTLDNRNIEDERSIQNLIGKVVRHFKGDLYIVLCEALESNTLKKQVVYKALYADNEVWIRDTDEFMSEVPEDKQNENITGQLYRFERYKPKRLSAYKEGD